MIHRGTLKLILHYTLGHQGNSSLLIGYTITEVHESGLKSKTKQYCLITSNIKILLKASMSFLHIPHRTTYICGFQGNKGSVWICIRKT